MSLTSKRLNEGDYTVNAFRTSRTVDIDFDRALGADQVEVMDGVRKRPPFLPEQLESTSERNDNGTYKKMVYDLVHHLYYRDGANDYERFGIENQQDVILDHIDGSQGRVTVVKVSPRTYGETIKPGTVRFDFQQSVNASVPPGSTVTDDGAGNLFAENGQIVGNVFYAQGVIVFTRRGATAGEGGLTTFFPNYAQYEPGPGGVDFDGFRAFRLRFDNRVTHYENEVTCEVLAHEFTWTENRSVKGADGALVDYATRDDFRPYITTVGLYDDQNNLVVVGKLDRPLRKPESIPLTISVKFDT